MTKVVYNACFGGFWLSVEAVEYLRAKHNVVIKPCGGTLARHDTRLVETVETLGSAKASGSCARLAVREISGKQYRIKEYDGNETVQVSADIEWVTVDE